MNDWTPLYRALTWLVLANEERARKHHERNLRYEAKPENREKRREWARRSRAKPENIEKHGARNRTRYYKIKNNQLKGKLNVIAKHIA